MDKDDQDWIKGHLEEVPDTGDNQFEFDLHLSTDGKHTVHIKADTKEGRKAGIKYAVAAYDKLVQRYGTKQSQAVKEYAKSPVEHGSLGKCKDCGAPNLLSAKGKKYCSDKCWLKN